ncbi:hypothetical protein [Paenibacillus sp. NPDC057967]|uniref:hypothetical protein n=1 Tax=Paenibacillus sp. NPDC057967 TaxID=3346293 RepID=UPI0036DE5A7D
MRFFSHILTIFGVLFAIASLLFTVVVGLITSETGDSDLSASISALVFMFYIPAFLLLFFGHRIRKNLRLKMAAPPQPAPEPSPVQVIQPQVQRRVETRTVVNVVESRPAPAPKKAVSVSVECKGCGARKAVITGESSTCDYCGSPLTARG